MILDLHGVASFVLPNRQESLLANSIKGESDEVSSLGIRDDDAQLISSFLMGRTGLTDTPLRGRSDDGQHFGLTI